MKKNLLMKSIVLAIAVTLALTAFVTGCSRQNDTSATTTTRSPANTTATATTTTTAAVDRFAEKLEITWIVYNPPNTPVPEGSEVQKIIEERFNVTIKIPQIDIHNAEQRNLFFAEGNPVDVMQTNAGMEYKVWADQGVLRPISEEKVRELMPNWMGSIDAMIAPEISRAQLTYMDKYWGVPFTNFSQALLVYIEALRGDWLENVGITKVPETIEEYHEVLKRFTFNDPNQSGAADTYGIHGGTTMYFNYVFGAYGVWPNSWYDWDGKIVYSSITEEYKAVLKLLQQWYKEGLIDPEFVTENRDMQRAKWADGTFGVLIDHPWWFAESTSNNLTAMLTNNDPDAVITFFKPITGPDGKSGGFKGMTQIINNAMYFGKDASDAKVERMMLIADELIGDEEHLWRCQFGIKGEHYDLDEDGITAPRAEFRTSEKLVELGLGNIFGLAPVGLDFMYATTKVGDLPPYNISFASNSNTVGVAFVTDGVNQVLRERGEDISTLASEFYYNAIAGDVDIDAQWDAYVESLNKAGLKEVIAEFEKIIVR